MRCLASSSIVRQQSLKKKKEDDGVAVVERVEVVAAAPAKESVAAPAVLAVMSSPQDMEARPQEVPVPSAGLTPPAPSLTAAAEDNQPPEPPVLPEAEVSSALAPRASPPLPSAWPSHGAPAPSGTLEEARAALDLLQGELQGPDCRLTQGRLGLISGWLKADASVRAAWGSAEEAQKALGVATTTRDLARQEATEAEKQCRMAEADLKALQDRQAAQASQLQEREEKLKAQEAAVASWDSR